MATLESTWDQEYPLNHKLGSNGLALKQQKKESLFSSYYCDLFHDHIPRLVQPREMGETDLEKCQITDLDPKSRLEKKMIETSFIVESMK